MDVLLTSVRFICNMLPAAMLEHLPLGLLYVACGVVLVHAPPCMAAYILPHAGDQVAIKALHALNQCPVYDVVVLSCAGLHGCPTGALWQRPVHDWRTARRLACSAVRFCQPHLHKKAKRRHYGAEVRCESWRCMFLAIWRHVLFVALARCTYFD